MIPVRTGVPGHGSVHDRYRACVGRSVTGLEVTLDRIGSDRPTAVRITKDGAGTERRKQVRNGGAVPLYGHRTRRIPRGQRGRPACSCGRHSVLRRWLIDSVTVPTPDRRSQLFHRATGIDGSALLPVCDGDGSRPTGPAVTARRERGHRFAYLFGTGTPWERDVDRIDTVHIEELFELVSRFLGVPAAPI